MKSMHEKGNRNRKGKPLKLEVYMTSYIYRGFLSDIYSPLKAAMLVRVVSKALLSNVKYIRILPVSPF